MKIIIIEDEPLAAAKLKEMLLDIDENLEILSILGSVKSALDWFAMHPLPDLVFSDIQVADGLSFDIFRQLETSCPIVFTTAYDQYAIDAFEVNSVDYLLKPIKLTKLAASLEKFAQMRSTFSQQDTRLKMDELANLIRTGNSGYKTRFLVRNGNRIKAIKTTEIAYFFSQEKLNFLITFQMEKFPVDHSLDEIGQMVDPRHFFRLNRKYLIHLDAASEIHPYFKGRLKVSLTPTVEEDVIVSAERTPSFKIWLDQ